MAIKPFTFDPALTERFVQLEYDLYRGDPNWIPPNRESARAKFSPEFHFYNNPENLHSHFLAVENGKILGRISAFINNDLKDRDGTKVGGIGFFECTENYFVAGELLMAATTWLSRHGIRRIWGPINFDIWHGYRFKTGGWNYKTFFGEPDNKPYYPQFFERFGFSVRQNWESVQIAGKKTLEAMCQGGLKCRQQLLDRGYRFEAFNKHDFDGEIRKLHAIISNSFSSFTGYTPISFSAFRNIISSSRVALDPRLLIFFYDERGSLAGFTGSFLEISDALRSMNGRSHVGAKLKFFYRRAQAERVVFFFGGMSREEIQKRSRLGRAGFAYMVDQILQAGYDDVIFALMSQDSRARGSVHGYPAGGTCHYALYELNQ